MTTDKHTHGAAKLKRSISLPLLTFYGLGTILGAGIYVLIGEVTHIAGVLSPLSFLFAGVLAAFTAFSYAELSARYPFSAGEAYYLQQGFGYHRLSALVGWLVVSIGITSAATIANGFSAYLGLFITLPDWVSTGLLIASLGIIAAIGIMESVALAALITCVEIIGLLLVIFVGRDGLLGTPDLVLLWSEQIDLKTSPLIFAGAFLAFYAFIGFEDMVNIAEEVKNPKRNLPLAIILALILSTSLYLLVSLTAVLSMPADTVSNTQAPLAEIMRQHKPEWVPMIGIISMVAVVNGALVQIIMASRVMYGMGDKNMGPAWLSQVNSRTQTPLAATAICTLLVLIFALAFELVELAKLTSFVTLVVFAGVNLSLLKVKLRTPTVKGIINVPLWVPVIGFILCMLFVLYEGISG